MRVYVPLTLPALSQAHGAGELGPAPFEAYAVTEGLRTWWDSEDGEELEYAALGQAAAASLWRLAEDYEATRRRVVVVAEAPDATVQPADGDAEDPVGRVRVTAPVPLTKAAAVHLDAEDAVEDVTAAIGALTAAAQGDEKAQAVVDGAGDHELLWFATQEIPALIG
ncbi:MULTISPECIES: DUF6912 family protein [Streptomyces]|uniref:Uncharacterized protein n=1 Tax=Streptomyces albus TaxID=1888 RepID=A0A8H1QLA0_9ACTN|nr:MULTISPECIES: hypothetical protein [Streptomyces]KPC73505.1 hypothetical protein ADL27_51040 [Streptomyces sp. NRRL F-6602]MDI6408398.1 hypothetical protein [Streptomyces albus]TGG77232.1 hypothetical protein D8771_27350 [Streptomyces albus]UVN56533.1 hypothetical protein NR995_19935 [Streptomyces albus]